MPRSLGATNAASQPTNNAIDPNRRFSCPHCPYSSSTMKKIEDHVLSGHTTTKAFKCNYCNYSAGAEFFVRAHSKLHTSSELPKNARSSSVEREPVMPKPQRRPLSNVGNDSSFSTPPSRNSSFSAQLQRTNSAAAADKTILCVSRTDSTRLKQKEELSTERTEPRRSRRSQFEAAQKEKRVEDEEKKKKVEECESLTRRRCSGKKDENEEDATKEKVEEEKVVEVGRRRSDRMTRGRLEEREKKEELMKAKALKGRCRKSSESSIKKGEECCEKRSVRHSSRFTEKSPVNYALVRRRSSVKKEDERGEKELSKPTVSSSVKIEDSNVEEQKEEKSEEVGKEEPSEIKMELKEDAMVDEIHRVDVKARKRGRRPLSAEEKTRRAEERRKSLVSKSTVESTTTEEKEEVDVRKRKPGRPSFAELADRASKMSKRVEVKIEKMEDGEENEDDPLEISALDAAIAEAEENAMREKTRAMMPVIERRNEEMRRPGNLKRVSFAPLPEKHHALHMPAKRRKVTRGEREGEAMMRPVRGFSSFSSFDVPLSARSISSSDSSGRRASIIEAMKARERQLEHNDEEEDVEEDTTIEVNPSISVIPAESTKKSIKEEFDSDYEGEEERSTVEAPVAHITPVRKTPSKSRIKTKPTVSPSESDSAKKKTTARAKKTPVIKSKSQSNAKCAAAAIRKRKKARITKLNRLKIELTHRLDKSLSLHNKTDRTIVEEEDRYLRTMTETTPLEYREHSGERKVLSWSEIHNSRRRLSIDVEPRREEGEKAESLHSVSSSVYLSRAVQLTKRSHYGGDVKVIKCFERARSPPLSWSYEEAESEEALTPFVYSHLEEDCELRCL